MEVRQILTHVCTLLGLDDVMANESADEKTLSLLLSALNFVIYEIYEQIPAYHTETVVSKDGIIPYDSFSKNLFKIKKIKKNGLKQSYKMVEEGIVVGCEGEWEVEYSYIPDEVELSDTIVLPPSISIRTISYGVAGEYSLYVGRFEDVETYDNRFESAMRVAKRKIVGTWKARGDGSVL